MLAADLDSQQIVLADTIAAGTALSAGLDLRGYKPILIFGPAAWTLATLCLQVSLDGTTWVDLTSATSSIIGFGTTAIVGVAAPPWSGTVSNYPDYIGRYLRFRSQTAGVDVNQAADRTIHVVAVPSNLRRP